MRGKHFPTQVRGKDLPTQVPGKDFPTDVRRNCILSIILLPGLPPHKLLRLDLGAGLEETDQLATLCLISTFLKYIWQARADKKVVTQYKMRAEVEALITILRKTRYSASADRLLEIII